MCCNRKHRLRERECSCNGRGKDHGNGFGLNRRFITKAEKVETLKKYREELVKEIAGIDEELSE